MNCEFMIASTPLPPCMPLPKAMLRLPVSNTAKAPTTMEALAGMKEIVPVIKDLLTKAIVENAIWKLEKIPEPECSQFVAATKARFLAEHDNSIRQRLTAAKAQEPNLKLPIDPHGTSWIRVDISRTGGRQL